MGFQGKTAVVTGGAQGIGLAVVKAFKKQGARVAVIDLQEGGAACDYFHKGDIADPAVLEQFSAACIKRFNRVDYLINNAMASRGGLSACGWDDFLYAQKVGVAAPYYLTRLLLPHFGKGAAIVNLSSTRAFQSQRDTESYSAAKGGITALTHALAVSLAGIARVNAVAPGWIDTAEQPHPGPDSAQHLVQRVGRPDDIAAAVLYLCGEHSGFITGQTLAVDGGMSKLMVYHGDEGWSLDDGEEL